LEFIKALPSHNGTGALALAACALGLTVLCEEPGVPGGTRGDRVNRRVIDFECEPIPMSAITKTDDGLVRTASVERRADMKASDQTTVAFPGGMMDNELKQYLDQKFADMHATFGDMHTEFASKFATKEDLERVETALLTEFHKWASPSEMRAKSHAQAIRLMDTELEALTERVQKLEGEKAS
jgi:hypothetical protein